MSIRAQVRQRTYDMPIDSDGNVTVSTLPGLAAGERYELRAGPDGGSVVVRTSAAAATADATATAVITKTTDGRRWADGVNEANRRSFDKMGRRV